MTIPMILIALNVVVSLLCFSNRDLFFKLDFQPYSIVRNKEWHRFVTHAFVHADFTHLLVNMYVLYNFSNTVYDAYGYYLGPKGTFYFSLLYLGGILFSTIPGFARHRENYSYHGVGASGAVSAVVYAFIVMFPTQSLRFILIPIDIPAWVFGIGYLILEYYLDKNSKSHIAHSAHYFGALFGVIMTVAINPDFVLKYLDL